jgi:16S rRNA (cytosine1402-N4)-methyltransferase
MMRNENYHTPVLLKETIDLLVVRNDGAYLDGTLGGGGHFRALAGCLVKGAQMVGIDRDPQAVVKNRSSEISSDVKVIIEQSRYSDFDKVLIQHDIRALAGAFLDLGVSSHQIDETERGFSYMQDSPLDMRMDPSTGVTAEELLRQTNIDELARILETYGEIINSVRMARTIKNYLRNKPLSTSSDLKECLSGEYGPNMRIKVLSKIFQALRIAVNDELGELERFLGKIPAYLSAGGRLAIISYHSLEDRIVKNFIRDKERGCVCPPQIPQCVCGNVIEFKRITKKAIQSSFDETRKNPRARSARLRVAEKVAA